MSHRDIIVIGGSAGSLPALVAVLRALPRDLPASVFVVMHLRSREKSHLSDVLRRASGLPAADAFDPQWIEPGRIYVAPPDHHMLIAEGHIHLSRGPKEGLHRPSINATFRSAAAAYKSRVVGVLLSGMLDDGASGLWEIVHQGGVSIIQEPSDAQFPSMPVSALEAVPINYKLKASGIGPLLVQLANSEASPMNAVATVNEISHDEFSGFTCPECRGPLYVHSPNPPEFVCRVGHRFPLETLIEEATATQERKLYEAVVSLEEGADMAEYATGGMLNGDREALQAEAKQLREHARAIRELIAERQAPPVDAPSNGRGRYRQDTPEPPPEQVSEGPRNPTRRPKGNGSARHKQTNGS